MLTEQEKSCFPKLESLAPDFTSDTTIVKLN
jgi:hypothetical protein